MLEKLEILNGILELEYNEYTYEYTVLVDNNVTSLNIDYVLKEDCFINIRNNIIDSDENIVYVDVFNEDNNITYTLYVYRDDVSEVSGIDNYVKSLEIPKNIEVSPYKIQLLAVGMFLCIVIVFSIIFRRKKIN